MIEDDDDVPVLPLPSALPSYARARDPVELLVKVKAEGMRLDHYLPIFFNDSSRSELQRAIAGGHVTVNGRAAKASYKVRNDDKLVVTLPEPIHDVIVAEDIPLEVLYEDDQLAVINKPANMVVHPARGNWSGTMSNALAFRFAGDLSTVNGNHRLGIVHRLDRDTTGAILVAKNDRAHAKLGMQFEKRTIFKEYVALVAGDPGRDADYIEAALKQHPHEREKQTVAANDDPEARPSTSYYEVAERFRGYSLVKVQPRTGRTHQIRVHMAAHRHPCVGDPLYGSDPMLSARLGLTRQWLHARRLSFAHPGTGDWVTFTSEYPADLAHALEVLRGD